MSKREALIQERREILEMCEAYDKRAKLNAKYGNAVQSKTGHAFESKATKPLVGGSSRKTQTGCRLWDGITKLEHALDQVFGAHAAQFGLRGEQHAVLHDGVGHGLDVVGRLGTERTGAPRIAGVDEVVHPGLVRR